MIEALLLSVPFLKSGLENQTELALENRALRQQLAILKRNRPHARLRWRDRLFWACIRAENRVLREKLGKKRILLHDDQRQRLAVKGKILGRKMLEQVATIVTPDIILRWHRELVAA